MKTAMKKTVMRGIRNIKAVIRKTAITKISWVIRKTAMRGTAMRKAAMRR
jgi:hypothetical protein